MSSKSGNKKQKVEETSAWTRFEEIPLPPRRAEEEDTDPYHTDYRNKRKSYEARLSESLMAAVGEGNIEFVRKILQTKRTRDVLHIRDHVPQRSFGSAIDYLYEHRGLTPPVQPYFGLGNVSWEDRFGYLQVENLVIKAVRSNQLEMLKELILRQRFNINAVDRRGRNPLTVAIYLGFDEIVHFLLNQPQIYITHPSTEAYYRGNGRSRPRCEDTALSVAAERGRLDIAAKLIEKGALQGSSTARPDNPYPMERYRAEALVDLSIKEALVRAYDHAGESIDRYALDIQLGSHYLIPKQECANVLELILSKTGVQKNNVVTVYVINRIKSNRWQDIERKTSYSYSYRLDYDQDFDRSTGTPRARAVAVARGLQALHPDSLRGFVHESDLVVLNEKYNQWLELVTICRQRLSTAGQDWMRSVDDAITAWKARPTFNAGEKIHMAKRNTQLLFWCHLFASPWSRERHAYYSAISQRYIKELLHIGSYMDKKHGHGGELKQVFDNEILPFAI